MARVYVLVCTTNPQILTVICWIHHPTHPMSKISSPILNFLDSDVCAVISFKNVGNFLVKSTSKTIEKPGTFKCARSRCKNCPFVQNADKISGPKRSVKIIDRFTCTSANVIYCITCTLCKKLYIGETGRRLGDRFRERLRDVEKLKMPKTHRNQSRGILISLSILKNTYLFAAFPYIRVPQTAAKT